VKNLVLSDDQLKSLFRDLFLTFTSDENVRENHDESCVKHGVTVCRLCSTIDTIYKDISTLFLKVAVSQFRKDFLVALRVEKTKALRKKVSEKRERKNQQFDISAIFNDKSENKLASHLRIKSEVMKCPDVLKNNCTKVQLLELCAAYGIKIAKNKNKSDMNEALVTAIKNVEAFENPHVFERQKSQSSGYCLGG
jgi:hypothetical protein